MEINIEKIRITESNTGVQESIEPPKNPWKNIIQKEKIALSVLRELISSQTIRVDFILPVINQSGALDKEVLYSITTKYEFPVEIFGDEYRLSKDKEGFFIFHPRWSIIGEGSNFDEAKEDLIRTIRQLKASYLKTKIENLDVRAIEFREYLLSLPV